MEKLVTIDMLAELFKVKPKTITRWIKRGDLPVPIRVRRQVRWRESTIVEFLESLEAELSEASEAEQFVR